MFSIFCFSNFYSKHVNFFPKFNVKRVVKRHRFFCIAGEFEILYIFMNYYCISNIWQYIYPLVSTSHLLKWRNVLCLAKSWWCCTSILSFEFQSALFLLSCICTSVPFMHVPLWNWLLMCSPDAFAYVTITTFITCFHHLFTVFGSLSWMHWMLCK